jgi:adenylate cyclase
LAEFRIGQCVLQPYRQLLAGGRAVPLPRKPLNLLSALAEARGGLVTKNELFNALWPGMIVEENALQAHVVTARKALGNDADRLETVRGLGYRLRAESVREPTPMLGTYEQTEPRLAVLALECASDSSELRQIAERLSDEMLYAAGRIIGLRVFGRASCLALVGKDREPSRVAALLGATHILSGLVKSVATEMRITIELSEAASGVQLWSGRFDANDSALDVIVGDSAKAVATVLGLSSGVEPAPPKLHPLAFDHYLRGRQLSGPPSTRAKCIEAFEAALGVDPNYAPAWSSLALARALRARWDVRTQSFAALKADVIMAVERALALDPASGPAQIALGILEPWAHYAARERRILAAVAAGPSDAEALRQQAEFTYCVGRIGEAATLAERTHHLDPLNPIVVQNYANLLSESGRTPEAFVQYELGRARWPDVQWFWYEPLMIAAFLGDWATVDVLMQQSGTREGWSAMAAYSASALRNPTPEICSAALERAREAMDANGRIDVSTLTFLYGLGLHEETFDLIAQSDYGHLRAEDGLGHDNSGVIPGIIFGVMSRHLRRDPRFVGLCAKLGLCAYWAETDKWPDCALELAGVYDFRKAALETLA